MNRKEHWENIYSKKAIDDVSWYQPNPEYAINLINTYSNTKNDAIIDIGAGDSFLPDFLLKDGFSDISVLDISEHAIDRAKERLGDLNKKINWIVSDITQFNSDKQFDVWYDRACFHFLTDPDDVKKYIAVLRHHLKESGIAIIGTFSENGPLKCSGIDIQRYSQDDFNQTFREHFELMETETIDHKTPFDTIQNFRFSILRKE